MGVYVTLTAEQVAYCDKIARLRQESAERNNRRGGNGGPVTGERAFHISLVGVRGEGAACKWLDLHPSQWQRFSETDIHGLPDLLNFIDVKTIDRAGRRLIVQPSSPGNWAYVLVNAERHPTYEIQGWIWGWQAKAARYLSDPVGGRAAYFVPARDLRPPSDLKELADWKKGPV